MKTIKIIDLLNKIANGEEVPNKIKYRDIAITYDEESQDYYKYWGEGLFSYLFSERDDVSFLNDEVEILDGEDEFEDIEEIDIDKVKDEFVNYNYNVYDLIYLFGVTMNQLIKNQKTIIERIKNNE